MHMIRKIIAFAVILLFVSLGFIPCINGNSDVELIESRNVKSNSRMEEFSAKLLEFKSLLNEYNNDDCGCEATSDWRFPAICSFLFVIFAFFIALFAILPGEGSFKYLGYAMDMADIANEFNCRWLFTLNTYFAQ